MSGGSKSFLANYRNLLVVVLAPLILSPLIFLEDRLETKCAFVVLLMAVYWIAEALPLPVTSFLPIFLFPLLGILPVSNTCFNYLKDSNFLFVGGLIVALATEESNLHKRIALRVLLLMGSQPRWLMLGFMLPTAFLSMWMSNVATVAMMAPIATCLLSELILHAKSTSSNGVQANGIKNGKNGHVYNQIRPTFCSVEISSDIEMSENEKSNGHAADPRSDRLAEKEKLCPSTVEMGVQTTNVEKKPEKVVKAQADTQELNLDGLSPEMKGLCKAAMLSICFAASLGGTGTLTGTAPNIVLTGQLDQFYPGQTSVTFASWMAFAIPPMLVCLILCWLLLLCVFIGWRSIFNITSRDQKSSDGGITEILRMRYNELGPISFAEYSIIGWFLTLVFLWVFRDPLFMPGWQVWIGLKKGYNSDAVAAMFVSVILFIWPNQMPGSSETTKKRGPLMTWSVITRRFPWGVVMLLGGGYALAAGVQASHLGHWIGCTMQEAVGHLPKPIISLIMVAMVVLITQIAANSAVATVFLPVLISMAQILKTNPLYFLLPTTIASSYAFLLPVSTPPNAVIFEYKMLSLKDMLLAGSILCVLCIAVNMLNLFTIADGLFDLNTVPVWALSTSKNFTCS